MPRLKIPSSSKSDDTPRTPRQHKPRKIRSMISSNSNTPGRLASLTSFDGEMDSFVLSPAPSRLSVLSDNTDIQEPRRRSWWRKLDEDCREVMEVLESNKNFEPGHVLEELDIEVLSQEQKSYNLELPESSGRESIASIIVPQRTLFTQKENQAPNTLGELISPKESVTDKQKKTRVIDIELPESSDSESISSIVIPQRQLFIQKENQPLNKLNELISSRESMDKQKKKKIIANEFANVNKSSLTNNNTSDVIKEIEIAKRQGKNLFGHHEAVKRKNLYTEFLTTESGNLTGNRTLVANSKEAVSKKNPVRKIFENRSGAKRIFAAFIGFESGNLSADEIVGDKNNELEAKNNQIRNIFGNNIETKKTNIYGEFVTSVNEGGVIVESQARAQREPSPTSSCTTDIDEWNQLPSSTMMEHQLLDEEETPFKKSRLSEIPRLDTANVNSIKTRLYNKSNFSQNTSKLSSDSVKENAQIRNVSQNTRSNSKKYFIQTEDKLPKILVNGESINIDTTKNNSLSNSKMTIINNSAKLQNASKQSNNIIASANNSKNQSNLQELPNKSLSKSNIKTTVPSLLKSNVDIKTFLEKEQNIDMNNEDIYELQKEQLGEESVHNNDNIEEGSAIRVESRVEININQEVEQRDGNMQGECHKNSMYHSQKHICGSEENNNENRNTYINQENEIDERDHKHCEINENDSNVANASKEVENQILENDEVQNENEIGIIDEMDYQETESDQEANKNEEIEEEKEDIKSIGTESKADDTDNENIVNDNGGGNDGYDGGENVNKSASDGDDENESAFDDDEEESADDNDQEDANDNDNEIAFALDDNNVTNDIGIDDNGDESSVEVNNVENDSVDNNDENESALEGSYIENDSVVNDNSDENATSIEDNNIRNDSFVDNNSDENETGNENNIEDNSLVDDHIDGNESSVADDNNSEVDDNDEANESAIDNNDDGEENDVNDYIEGGESAIGESGDEVHSLNERAVNISDSDDDSESEEQVVKEISSQQGSPEAILRVNSKQELSFTTRYNTLHATKSMINDLNIKKSLVPLRESTRVSDGITDSSTERSGWDSHRTTRKTLRQTFGRDFTPRKSLRTLVMEKSAKRQTVVTSLNQSEEFPNVDTKELQHKSSFGFEDNHNISDHEESMPRKQAALEMQFNKHVAELKERLFKLGEEGKSSLNKIKRVPYDPFRVPSKPAFSTQEQKVTKKKTKKQHNYVIPDDMLPKEFLKDLKYKPPKRFQPRNVGWTTKRLYRFLESKLEPYFDYRARVRAERVVRDIYDFVMGIRKVQVAPPDAINSLKREMARLDIVRTHYEFYTFFREYMPKEVRFKVIPNLINKLPLPRDLHEDILQDHR